MLFKDNSLEFEDAGVKEGIVSGYFASFDDEPDSDGDIIQRGAFSKTLSENGPLGKGRIRHLQDHDWSKGVGLITELFEDQKGVRYVSKVGRHTLGKDFLLMVEDGIIKEHSFGYRIIKSQKSDKGYNLLTELKMWEGSSLQGWGANGNTHFNWLKSDSDVIEHFDKLYKALKNGTYSDETMLIIQEKYNTISEYFKTTQPDISTVPSEGKEENQKFSETLKQALGAWQVKASC